MTPVKTDGVQSAQPGAARIGQSDVAELAKRVAELTQRPLVLVGLMGSGKTTVGRKLAALLDRSFTDADEAIEAAAQRSVTEIFDEFGEAYFRDGERRVIARLLDDRPGVIATGGGAFVDDRTRALILEKGIAVWIDCDIDTLVERTARRDTRPLLRGGDPKTILTKMRTDRSPAYTQAHVRVTGEASSHRDMAAAILSAVDRWL
ncbi:MAG: shikimate kinase [Parerythrobacter sp.]